MVIVINYFFSPIISTLIEKFLLQNLTKKKKKTKAYPRNFKQKIQINLN